jgi:hypothetical protein
LQRNLIVPIQDLPGCLRLAPEVCGKPVDKTCIHQQAHLEGRTMRRFAGVVDSGVGLLQLARCLVTGAQEEPGQRAQQPQFVRHLRQC